MSHQPVRMHIASIGISKICFLFSLAFCGLLFLLIPALQPPAHQLDWPRPRPQVRQAQARLSKHRGISTASAYSEIAESTTRLISSSAGQKDKTEITKNDSPQGAGDSEGGVHLQEHGGGPSGYRSQDLLMLEDIFIAVKTTRKYHLSRLELLIKTWISQAKEHVRRAAHLSHGIPKTIAIFKNNIRVWNFCSQLT